MTRTLRTLSKCSPEFSENVALIATSMTLLSLIDFPLLYF